MARITEVLRLDSRGRLVIPRAMRKSLALKENSQIMMICDAENKELKIIPLPFHEDGQAVVKMKITIRDVAGSLARIANTIAEKKISLLYGETVVIKKGEEAEWTVIAPVPEEPMDDLIKYLKEKGGAISVTVEEPTFPANSDNSEDE
jgi:bifunctional DNA-binding transcriptional regulator/antitoxin component of YhaV-PrlF toxin-antitoxin module